MSEEETERTEIDLMAERYSKKWKVPPEEAKKKIQQFLEKKPMDRSKLAPSTDLLFPDPIGPISKKLQDISQGALATAYTRKALKDMSTPPKELETMQEKIEFMEKTMSNVVDLVNTTMKDMQQTLETQKAEKEKEALLEEVAGVIRPLKEKVELLEKAKEGTPGAMIELTPEKILEAGREATSRAQKLLETQGFEVELPKGLTVEQVDAKIKEALEVKRQEWQEKEGKEVEVEKERIRATEEILTTVTDRVFNVFLEPIRDKIHEAIEKGAFQRPPTPRT